MSIKMQNPPHEKTNGIHRVISAIRAAERLGLAQNTFFKELDKRHPEKIHPQAFIEAEEQGRPSYGFVTEYIDEILRLLPSKEKRSPGKKIFTTDIKMKIEKINKKWDKLYPLK